MDLLPTIDIEGKTLSCSEKELEKLRSPDGCNLQLINDRVYNLDPSAASDDEYDDDDDDVYDGDGRPTERDYYSNKGRHLTEQARLARIKKEFISLSLNSNRDPIKSSSIEEQQQLKLQSVAEGDDEAGGNQQSSMGEIPNIDSQYERIHKRYKSLNDYESLISNKENSFQQLESGKVFKRPLIAGCGPLIGQDSLVFYNCAFWTQGNADPYDSTWLRHKTLITDMSTDHILPGLRELLLSAKQGEWFEALIRPELAFGPLGVMPRIPPNATLFCLMEVIRVVTKDKLAILLNEDKDGLDFKQLYAASNEARMRGNYYYELHQFKAALQRYKSGIRLLEAITYKNEEEEREAQGLLLKLYNNSARAANALNNPRLALAACKQASLIDEMSPKTHWHRMSAWRIKGHPDRALGAARRALQLFHADPNVYKSFQREAEELKKLIQNEKFDLDELHRLMGRALLAGR